MTINYDEKGKIYTNIVAKEAIPARIQTTTHYMEGEIHVRPDCRFKDELDLDEPFLALTNVSVFDANQEVLFRTSFMAIRRDQLVWVTLEDEIKR